MVPLEIERKFLINLPENIDSLCSGRMDISQIYLVRSSPDIQRRIRSIASGGAVKYFYTEKKFVSPSVREENEREINREEYDELYIQKDPDIEPVIKTRRILVYKNQRFEIDSYPFSDTLATIELELENEGQCISFPSFLDVIKEVTGDSRYSNAQLANNGCFPETGNE